MTLVELETRLQELRAEGAKDNDAVWIPCCAGWTELAFLARKPDLQIIALYKRDDRS